MPNDDYNSLTNSGLNSLKNLVTLRRLGVISLVIGRYQPAILTTQYVVSDRFVDRNPYIRIVRYKYLLLKTLIW